VILSYPWWIDKCKKIWIKIVRASMATICTIVNNIEVSSYGELEAREVGLVIQAQLQKGD
jgi:hypothetical protein